MFAIAVIGYLACVAAVAVALSGLTEPAHRWTVRAAVIGAGIALTILPGELPLPIPVVVLVGTCASNGCHELSYGELVTATVVPMLLQAGVAAFIADAVRRMKAGE